MKHYKKGILAILVLLTTACVTAKAQTTDTTVTAGPPAATSLKKGGAVERAQAQSDRMKEKLQLSDDQYKQVSAINEEYALKMESVLQGGGGRWSKYRELKPLMKEKDKKLKAVLTADQYKQYEAMKQEMMDKAREQYRGGQ